MIKCSTACNALEGLTALLQCICFYGYTTIKKSCCYWSAIIHNFLHDSFSYELGYQQVSEQIKVGQSRAVLYIYFFVSLYLFELLLIYGGWNLRSKTLGGIGGSSERWRQDPKVPKRY